MKTDSRYRARLSVWLVWRWPMALALLTAGGLVMALVTDGIGDWVGWIALLVPTVISSHALVRGMRSAVVHGDRVGRAPPAALRMGASRNLPR